MRNLQECAQIIFLTKNSDRIYSIFFIVTCQKKEENVIDNDRNLISLIFALCSLIWTIFFPFPFSSSCLSTCSRSEERNQQEKSVQFLIFCRCCPCKTTNRFKYNEMNVKRWFQNESFLLFLFCLRSFCHYSLIRSFANDRVNIRSSWRGQLSERINWIRGMANNRNQWLVKRQIVSHCIPSRCSLAQIDA